MKIEIKNRYTESVMFSEEAESIKAICVILAGRGADLRGADLRGADLRGANLREADLYGADLYGADLYGANLREADLSEANLRGADLREADLRGADLRGANLRGADLGDNVCIQIGPIGSRKDYLIAIHTKGKTEYRAGCWTGSVKEFLAKVEETHKGNSHAAEYIAAIELCEMMLKSRIAAATPKPGGPK